MTHIPTNLIHSDCFTLGEEPKCSHTFVLKTSFPYDGDLLVSFWPLADMKVLVQFQGFENGKRKVNYIEEHGINHEGLLDGLYDEFGQELEKDSGNPDYYSRIYSISDFVAISFAQFNSYAKEMTLADRSAAVMDSDDFNELFDTPFVTHIKRPVFDRFLNYAKAIIYDDKAAALAASLSKKETDPPFKLGDLEL